MACTTAAKRGTPREIWLVRPRAGRGAALPSRTPSVRHSVSRLLAAAEESTPHTVRRLMHPRPRLRHEGAQTQSLVQKVGFNFYFNFFLANTGLVAVPKFIAGAFGFNGPLVYAQRGDMCRRGARVRSPLV